MGRDCVLDVVQWMPAFYTMADHIKWLYGLNVGMIDGCIKLITIPSLPMEGQMHAV